jgi:demethylmenaquinone methyltransferase/2-methoxy-6-polyprenyl-1,4-benzoquinol methylase
MFIAVPPHYDLINRLFTWGLDKRWRHQAAQECLKGHPKRLLDLCCGTGDLAMRLANMTTDDVSIMGIDFSLPMLRLAREKAKSSDKSDRVAFVYGDAATLPFPDEDFDCIGISFAFRNLTYKNRLALRYLAEVLRVLQPGGRFVIVESSQPGLRPIRKLFHFYLRRFVSPLGRFLSGNRGAYQYLAESASRFYTVEELRNLMLEAGFNRFSSRRLTFGAVAIHVATK